MELLRTLITDYTLRTVAMGAASLGAVAGALGTFAVLRRQSLLGDAISHAALPGIALAFLLTGSKAPLVLVLGAAMSGWVATLLIMAVVRLTRIKEDAALGLLLAVFFGIGLVLLTYIQHLPNAAQAGLDTYLFGQAAAMLERDVATIGTLGALALLALVAFWKEFKLLAFDPDFGAAIGLPMRRVDGLLTALLVLAIVIGLQTVGVVLMSAILVAPAAAARQWSNRLGSVTLAAGFVGALSGAAGAVLSAAVPRVPTGPTIVLLAGAFVTVSMLFAPERGLVAAAFRRRRLRNRVERDAVLLDLYDLALEHEGRRHAHPESVLALMRGLSPRSALEALAALGWAERTDSGDWLITEDGRLEAERRLEANER